MRGSCGAAENRAHEKDYVSVKPFGELLTIVLIYAADEQAARPS